MATFDSEKVITEHTESFDGTRASSRNEKEPVLDADLHTEKERKRVLRKMDLHLLPFVSLLYLLSFL